MEMYAGVRNVRVMGQMEDEKREREAREIAGENKICRRVKKSRRGERTTVGAPKNASGPALN